MAEWKKVVVSGSSAILSQLNVGANQQITTAQATTFLTGSFTGSFTGNGAGLTGVTNATTLASLTQGTGIASFTFNGSAAQTVALKNAGSLTNNLITKWDSSNGQLVNASLTDNGTTITGATSIQLTGANSNLSGSFSGSFQGNGAGLTGVTATAIFPTTAKTDLATTDQIYINDGANKFVTYGNLVTDLAGSGAGTSNLTTTDTGDSLALTAQVTVTGVTASLFGTASYAIQALSASFASTAPYSGLTGVPAGIVSASVLAAGSGQGSTTLTTNGVSSGDVTATGLGTAGTPTFAGLTISTNALAVNNTNGITTNAATFPIANATATTINLGGGATAINIGSGTGITTINHDARVKGALYVDGPITAISSSNLYVADQFILLASGSATNTDGGIVIDRGSYAGLNIAYGFDSTTGRWGYQAGVTDTSNTIDPTGISGSFAGYVFTEAAHTATKPTTGEFVQAGAIYTQTDGTIWMYA